jgi:integrase
MEKLMEEVKQSRNVRDTSIALYKRHLNKLAMDITGKEYENEKFLKTKADEIIKYLDDKSNSVRRNFSASIMVALSPKQKNSPTDEYRGVYERYAKLLTEGQANYLESKKDNKMNSKEEKNWMNFDEVISLRDNLSKKLKKEGIKMTSTDISKSNFDLLQQYLVLSLYTMQAPRRNEYATMKIINKKEYLDLDKEDLKKNNYLVNLSKTNKLFSYGSDKVKSKIEGGSNTVNITKELNTVLNLWLHFNKSDNLLVTQQGGMGMTKNQLTLLLNRIFKPKMISTSMLRKIYLTNMFGDEAERNSKKQKIAEEMNHSIGQVQNLYIKDV